MNYYEECCVGQSSIKEQEIRCMNKRANIFFDWCGDQKSPHHVTGGLLYTSPWWWNRRKAKTRKQYKKAQAKGRESVWK